MIDGVKQCLDCKKGCAKCLDNLPDVCSECEPGLVNFNYTACLSECPEGYAVNNKSGNCIDIRKKCPYGYELNSTDECELAVQECEPGYVLNGASNSCVPIPGFYVPFPSLGLILIFTIILIIRVKCKKC